MLTNFRKFNKWKFSLYGTDKNQTDVYKFIEKHFDTKEAGKLEQILQMIDTDPFTFQHPQKFKRLENEVWEIKFRSGNRIACIWESDHTTLVGFYGFRKKQNRWPKRNLDQMRNAKKEFLDLKIKRNEGNSK